MNVFEFLALAVVAISAGGVIVVDRIFGARRHLKQTELMLAERANQELQQRVVELERHNDELRQQLEWNRRLLEAQDRVLQQLGAAGQRDQLPAGERAPYSR